MKKVEHYVCDICGMEYADKGKCRQCEKGHKNPEEIVKVHHAPIVSDRTGYPDTIDILMSDKKTVRYKRIRHM